MCKEHVSPVQITRVPHISNMILTCFHKLHFGCVDSHVTTCVFAHEIFVCFLFKSFPSSNFGSRYEQNSNKNGSKTMRHLVKVVL